MDLLIDIKYYIATKDPEAWFKLWWLDEECKHILTFNKYIELFVYQKENIIYFPFDVWYVYYDEKITIYNITFEKGSYVWYKKYKLHCLFEPAYQDPFGNKIWSKEGKYHRDGDEPAIIESDGTKRWFKEGLWHRDGDAPAIIESDGSKFWYKEGKLHRDGDEPAVILSDGTKEWYKEGQYHREGNQPAMILADGSKRWYKEGKLHRDGDEPAVIRADGTKEWYKYGKKID